MTAGDPDAPGAAVSTEAGELDVRYAPGEDIVPLMRGLGGGLLGGLAALAIDWAIPALPTTRWLLPTLCARALPGGGGDVTVGAAAWLVVAALVALAFAYGQFRRFVGGPPHLAGLVWGVLILLLSAPAILPVVVPDLADAAARSPAALVARSALLVAESATATLVYGMVVGWANPRRRARRQDDCPS